MDLATSLLCEQVSNPCAPTPSSALRAAQHRALTERRRCPGALARTLFRTLDLVYGKCSTLPKFVVLELVARVPYQAWENVGYVAISHTQASPHFGRRIFDDVREARAQQDNEQWHLFILQELVQRRGERLSWWRFAAIPQLLAFIYYHVSWLLYVVNPRQSYALNVDFEQHAERTYMAFVRDHPELDAERWSSAYTREYGSYATVGDLLRRIALDERAHWRESLEKVRGARFRLVSVRHPTA